MVSSDSPGGGGVQGEQGSSISSTVRPHGQGSRDAQPLLAGRRTGPAGLAEPVRTPPTARPGSGTPHQIPAVGTGGADADQLQIRQVSPCRRCHSPQTVARAHRLKLIGVRASRSDKRNLVRMPEPGGLWARSRDRLSQPAERCPAASSSGCASRDPWRAAEVLLMDEPARPWTPPPPASREDHRDLKTDVTIVIVTPQHAAAQRVPALCLFLAENNERAHIVESGPTGAMFRRPDRPAHRRLRARALRLEAIGVQMDLAKSFRASCGTLCPMP